MLGPVRDRGRGGMHALVPLMAVRETRLRSSSRSRRGTQGAKMMRTEDLQPADIASSLSGDIAFRSIAGAVPRRSTGNGNMGVCVPGGRDSEAHYYVVTNCAVCRARSHSQHARDERPTQPASGIRTCERRAATGAEPRVRSACSSVRIVDSLLERDNPFDSARARVRDQRLAERTDCDACFLRAGRGCIGARFSARVQSK